MVVVAYGNSGVGELWWLLNLNLLSFWRYFFYLFCVFCIFRKKSSIYLKNALVVHLCSFCNFYGMDKGASVIKVQFLFNSDSFQIIFVE